MKKLVPLICVNMLTLFRILGVFCIYPVFKKYGGLDAAILSAFCYLTDVFDGVCARKLHVASFLGSLLDASADKMFSLANLLVLLSITNYTIFPVICELIIFGIQAIKFSQNGNVQSSKLGKIKTWFIGAAVVLLFFISDYKKIAFLPLCLVNFIEKVGLKDLYFIILLPLYIAEILALVSYIKSIKVYTSEDKEKTTNIKVKLIKEKNFKDKLKNFANVWMNNEFYEKYKDNAGYKDILKEVKKRRKSW